MNVLARRALCSLRSVPHPRVISQTRLIHASHPVLKKKRVVEIDNLFDDLEIIDEPSPHLSKQPTSSHQPTSSSPPTSTSGRTSKNLSVEERQRRFNETVEFIKPRIGRKPKQNLPTVRNSAWLILLQMAASEAEMKQVVDLMPAWKERGRAFNPAYSEAFVRRCQELSCPLLALEVYGNYAKYKTPLSLPAARQLLHSLHRLHPLENLMTASALFGLYNLPPAAQDYVSCAIIVDACLRHDSVDSNNIAEALLPHLRRLQAGSDIDTADTYHRENVWVQRAMKSVEDVLQKRKDSPSPLVDVLSATAAQEQAASL